MVLYLVLSFFLSTMQVNGFIQNELETTQFMSDELISFTDDEMKCGGQCVFPDNSIQQSNGFPVIITQPGQYCVVENLSIPANSDGIIIEADNVILDLNGYCITGATNSSNGILVRRSMGVTTRTNITICNGAIRTMGNIGIAFNAATQGILLNNLKVLNCRGDGITMTAVQQLIIENCITSGNNYNGILITQSGSTLSNNCILNNCLSTFNGTDGLQLISCQNFNITNMLCFNNSYVGFDEFTGNTIRFANCQAYNNGRNNTAAIGFFSEGNNNSYEQCIANNNAKIGFQLNGTGNGTTIENCQAKSNGINGFDIAGTNHCILNNLAKSNVTNGFLLATNSTQCQIRSNTAVANGTGFANNTTTVNRIYSNFASNNTTNFVGVPNVSTSPTAVTAINFTANIAN
jgi:Right handed beta helix region